MHAQSPHSTVALRQRGFTITELLVVIGIIVLLVGILLPALGKVREKSRVTETTSVMEEFAKGCDAFIQQFGYAPGIVPEEFLAADPKITPMENAVLHLAGGAIREDELPVYINGTQYDTLESVRFDPDDPGSSGEIITFNRPGGSLRIVVNSQAVGDGPFVQGKRYAPFYSPKESLFRPAKYNLGEEGSNGELEFVPSVLDAWGQPIMYARRLRSNGELSGAMFANDGSQRMVQFSLDSQTRLMNAESLGDFGQDQTRYSILRRATDKQSTFAQILRTPAIGAAKQPQSGAPRGEYILISAGTDGVFFNIGDGPGTPGSPVTNIVDSAQHGTPTVVSEYDDIIVAGGG